MQRASKRSNWGFTFVELMVSLAVGLMVIGLSVKLFSLGMDATWVISQKAEMQQDLRATTDLLMKDVSLAGAGLPLGQAIALPTGTGTTSIYGYSPTCAVNNNCVAGNGIAFPCSTNVGLCVPTMYGLIPGYQLGITPPGSATQSDVITVVYTDPVLALNCYEVSVDATGQIVTFFAPPNPIPANWTPACVLPPNVNFPQAVNNQVVGLQPGDNILFQGNVAGNTAYVVGEVTNVTPGAGAPGANTGPSYTVNFNAGDTLKLNQPAAPSGDLIALHNSPLTANIATRIYVISYYLWLLPDPINAGPGTPVLMRQVNGQPPVPVAENVVNMQFTYDTYNSNGTLLNNSGNGGYPTTSYSLIRKININHLTIRSQMTGARSALYATSGYQGFDIQTSISARNLSYQNRYSF